MKNISAVVLAKNEESVLSQCLQSLSFCDEIIVINDESTDKTTSIAKSFGAKVINRSLNNNYADQRNTAMSLVKNAWVLYVDADEVVSKSLAQEITSLNPNENTRAFRIKRRDIWWGKPLRYGEVRKASENGIIRLVKKDAGIWKGAVHEEFQTDTHIETCSHYLNHFAHRSIHEFLTHINVYSTIRAHELQKQKKSSNVFTIIMYPFGKFLYTYFLLLGFLDGAGGFVYSFMMSFHSFLVRSKLYQYTKIDR